MYFNSSNSCNLELIYPALILIRAIRRVTRQSRLTAIHLEFGLNHFALKVFTKYMDFLKSSISPLERRVKV